MNPSFREILELLNKFDVEYIVVGGVAAVIQGAPVTTFDIDTLIRVNEVNAARLEGALNELDARFREHQTNFRPTKKDILAGGHLLLMTRAGPLDVLGFIGENDCYEDLITKSTPIPMAGGAINILNLEELIRQKKTTDRPKDRATIELLEEVLRNRSSNG